MIQRQDSNYLYYIATRCLRVCLLVCLWPISSGMAGPIWLNFFLLALSWLRDGLRPKNPDLGSGFSRNPE